MLLVFASLLLVTGCATTPPNSLATHDPAKWERDIAAYEASVRTFTAAVAALNAAKTAYEVAMKRD